jgi:hypothetical protein
LVLLAVAGQEMAEALTPDVLKLLVRSCNSNICLGTVKSAAAASKRQASKQQAPSKQQASSEPIAAATSATQMHYSRSVTATGAKLATNENAGGGSCCVARSNL